MSKFLLGSTIFALIFALFALQIGGLSFEATLLASVIFVFAGILPDVDGSDSGSTRETVTALAAFSPLIMLSYYPGLIDGGVARVALAVIGAYLVSRLVLGVVFSRVFRPGGLLHSIPAAIVTAQFVYLIFIDMPLYERIFLVAASFLGYVSHLLLEFYLEFDLVGRASGRYPKKSGVLKLFGDTWLGNSALYLTMFFLGWVILTDLYPNLGFQAQLTY